MLSERYLCPRYHSLLVGKHRTSFEDQICYFWRHDLQLPTADPMVYPNFDYALDIGHVQLATLTGQDAGGRFLVNSGTVLIAVRLVYAAVYLAQ
jgi:hypothetical protein